MKPYKIVYSSQYERDLEQIAEYYTENGEEVAGYRIDQRIEQAAQRLKIFPELHSRAEWSKDIRVTFAKPYRLYFRVINRNKKVILLRVIHMARNVNQAEIEDF